MSTILGILTACAAIVGGLVYWSKVAVWRFVKTPEQDKETVDKSVDKSEDAFRSSGRPQE